MERLSQLVRQATEELQALQTAAVGSAQPVETVGVSSPTSSLNRSSSTITQRPSTSSTSTRHTDSLRPVFRNGRDEVRHTFRPYNFETKKKSSSKITKSHQKLTRTFILIDPFVEMVPSMEQRAQAYKEKRVKNLTIHKDWTESEVRLFIREQFALEKDATFEILMNWGKTLLSLPLDGEILDGQNMHSNFLQKSVVYVRPHDFLQDDEDDKAETFKIIVQDTIADDAIRQDHDDNPADIIEELRPFHFEQELLNVQDKITDELLFLNVMRDSVLTSLSNLLQKDTFSPFKRLHVTFIGEPGIDGGGLNRELWRCALEALRKSNIFEGRDYSKTVTYDLMLLVRNKYFEAGQIMAMSILHGGPPPQFLSKTLVALFLGGLSCTGVELGLEDVATIVEHNELKKVAEAETLDDLNEKVLASDFLVKKCNIGSSLANMDEKELILKAAIKRQAVHMKYESYVQFFSGLNTCGIGPVLKCNPEKTHELLTYKGIDITAQQLNNLLAIDWSEVGSNYRRLEERTILNWRDYLVDCEDPTSSVKISTILYFITGSHQIPPLGFAKPRSLKFKHDTTDIYPTFNTCDISMLMPVKEYSPYSDFKELMNTVFVKENEVFNLF